jgi:hypothetical protein
MRRDEPIAFTLFHFFAGMVILGIVGITLVNHLLG